MNEKVIINKEMGFMTFKQLSEEGVINAFAFKPNNYRTNQYTKEEILEGYKKLSNKLNVKITKYIKPIQTHTNIVKVVNDKNIDDSFKDVDGLITDLKDVALITSLADCQGILLYDKEKKVIGNVHSGWVGTLNRIISNAIDLMIKTYNSKPENIEAYICPSILKCCFEVDEDVANRFKEEFKDIDIDNLITKGDIKDNKQKYYIDTVLVNKKVLLNLGLKEDNIILSNICSKCHNDFIHSHRADGINSGRNIALICLK